MHPPSAAPARSSRFAVEARSISRAVRAAVLLVTGTIACGPAEPTPTEAPALAQHSQHLDGLNGLSLNGLSLNGLSLNGLSLNGLSLNGLSAPVFASWFSQAPAHSDMVMRYVVLCALPQGESRTYTAPGTQVTYTWHGSFGLAPGWASGQPPTLVEQQLISACLAAHVNKYGIAVPISVLGQDAAGQLIPFSAEELKQYSRRDACFFGNLFTGQGLFFGTDGARLHDAESSTRVCALTSDDPALANACSPMAYAGRCKELCTRIPGEAFYLSCTANGVTYRALTTRVRRADIYRCGDGVCQLTESCGRGKRSRSCQSDCGRCSGDVGTGGDGDEDGEGEGD